MPFALNCPNCQANFLLPDELAGRQVKCQRCAEVFRAPVAEAPVEEAVADARPAQEPSAPSPPRSHRDDFDSDIDRTRRRRYRWDERRPPRAGTRAAERRTDPWVVIGIIGGAVLFVGSIVLLIVMFNAPRPQPIVWKGAPFAVKPVGPGMFPPNLGPLPPLDDAKAFRVVLYKGAFEGDFVLLGADPIDPAMRHPCKVFLAPLEAGKTYMIDHKRFANFDPYLRVENADGIQIAADDDGGGNLNSRIQIVATRTGMHRIIATTLGGGFGNFKLEIRDINQPALAPGPAPGPFVPKLNAKNAVLPGVVNDNLAPDDQVAIGAFKKRGKQHVLKLEANASYGVQCKGPNMVCVVYVLDDEGTILHAQDGAGVKAAPLFRPSVAGPYRFVVTPLNQGQGDYTLTVQKQLAKPAPRPRK